GEYLLGGATSSSFPCSGQPYWVPVRKPRGPSPRFRRVVSRCPWTAIPLLRSAMVRQPTLNSAGSG
ncbi:hypothetical protein ACFRFN_40980, partial [Streptomyces mirabilis]